jgi:molecular chaperone GrpE
MMMVAKQTKVKKDKEKELEIQLARALADYDNLNKRVERERVENAVYANLKLVMKFLPIFDMLEQSQSHLKDPGIAIALKEIDDLMKSESVERINADEGVKYDEEMHEVVEVVDGKKSGVISETVLSGWKYEDGLVIRPAKVKVTKKV